MRDYEDLIAELSDLCGIMSEYWDIYGKRHQTGLDAKKAVLKAMGLNIGSTDEIAREIEHRKFRPWKDYAEPVHVVSVGSQPISIPVHIPIGQGNESGLSISWYLLDEEKASSGRKNPAVISGSGLRIHEAQWIDGVRHIKVLIVDNERRDIGYYAFRAEFRHPEGVFPGRMKRILARSRVIVAPETCYMPPELEKGGKVWGLSVNLYALRSRENWGAGDFADLRRTMKWLTHAGGSFIGINPLHAVPNTSPFGVSPYAPLSRLYKNHLYLDLKRVPEAASSLELNKFMGTRRFRARLRELRKKDFVDYEAASDIKEEVLRKAFSLFMKKHFTKKTRRGGDFRAYVSEEGRELASFSLFMALRGYMKRTKNACSYKDWPVEYRNRNGKAVRKFMESHAREIIFHQYVQWLIDGQLRELCADARKLRMKIGLYFDLAVGSVGGGSDAWSHSGVMARGADVGAPPDDFSPDGQKWGFPPLIPEKLRETGYELFIRTIRKNMKYGGAIRIDHALGLFRIFWIPEGLSAKEGAYVRQPSEDLLGIIALESVRNKTMVIAEDLGTISENMREALKRRRMLSLRLFYFERNYPDPSFLPPDGYPEMALCAVTTHDLPTLYGYWRGRDIEIRRTLGGGPPDMWQKQLADRERDKRLILKALKSQGLLPMDFAVQSKAVPGMTSDLCLAIYRYLAGTPCKLLLVSPDDVMGTLNQQNLPGTVSEYPNWIQKTPLFLEEILKDKRLTELAGALGSRNAFA